MNTDVEFHIKHSYSWTKLPGNIKQLLGNSQSEYDGAVLNYSIKNQLQHKGNLVKHVIKDQRKYYEKLLVYSREHLMLYPYHLSDFMVQGLRVTPFAYYHQMMRDIMTAEKSYDSLPNFAAADCLRLLGIGRNQYIDLMNATKSANRMVSKLFNMRKKNEKSLLPTMPIEGIGVEPWWVVKVSLISDDDVKACTADEKALIDELIGYTEETKEHKLAGAVNQKILQALYRRGFVYLDVPIQESDRISVPPLEGFVMNRVIGDYFETLLYKIFVSIDEQTPIGELANVLEIDPQLVMNAISVYCRLGFARKKFWDMPVEGLHESWASTPSKNTESGDLLIDWDNFDITDSADDSESLGPLTPVHESLDELEMQAAEPVTPSLNHTKRVAFLFDSTLTAFLMMGNLSPGLKNHAVTMFEVGKLSDEMMDSFVGELEKVGSDAEGEAQRYFDHAVLLRDSILFLRNNKQLLSESGSPLGLDLVRCESLLGLDAQVCQKLLNKNYELLISMAPLSNEIRSISSCTPPHLGPAIPEVSSVWFKLFIYHITSSGPPSLLIPKGTKLRKLPAEFKNYEQVLLTTWGHDPSVVPCSNILVTLHDCLIYSAVLVQAYSQANSRGSVKYLSFPFNQSQESSDSSPNLLNHPAVCKLSDSCIDLTSNCGFIALINPTGSSYDSSASLTEMDDTPPNSLAEPGTGTETPEKIDHSEWFLLECCFGLPLFNTKLNQEICTKVITQNLLDKASLNKLKESSRNLTVDLLQFISQHQDLPVVGESVVEGSMLPFQFSLEDQKLPLPTKCLYFNGKSLANNWR